MTEAAKAIEKQKSNLRLIKAAEKRLAKRKLRIVSNADQIRYLAVIALRMAKQPLSLHQLERAFRDALRFKIRGEYLLMELLCKRKQTHIELMPDVDGVMFRLKEWKTDEAHKVQA